VLLNAISVKSDLDVLDGPFIGGGWDQEEDGTVLILLLLLY
jgi:hypothetical protein